MLDNIKARYQQIRKDPMAWSMFNLRVIQIFLGTVGAIVTWQFIKVIIGFNAGNSTMTMVGRLISFALMVYILYKGYNMGYVRLRERILHNSRVPLENQQVVKYTDKEIEDMVNQTIDDIEKREDKK